MKRLQRHIKYERKKQKNVSSRTKKGKLNVKKIFLPINKRKCFETKVLRELGTSLFVFNWY